MAVTAKTATPDLQRSPGRPRAFATEEVLVAALELFWKNGYRNTTTRDLEQALGLSQSSIYNAFGSKQNLLEAALDRYEAITERELLMPLEQAEDGLASVDRFLLSLGHWVTHDGRRGCMLINMMAEDGGSTDDITRRARRYRERVRTAMRTAISRAIRDGDAVPLEVEARVEMLITSVLGLNIAARGGASDAELNQLLNGIRSEVKSWRVVTQ